MTSPAVDLAAVARARAELAALVVAHPSLTSPEAHARLAAALPELTMPPRLDPESADSTIIGVRLSREMVDALDREVARQCADNPDLPISKSSVLRGIVRRALLNTAPSQPIAAPPAPEEPPLVRAPSVPPRRATLPPARASVRPAALPSVPSPRVPADLVVPEAVELVDAAPSVALPPSPRVPADLAAEPDNDTRQLALIAEPPTSPTLSAEKVRVRLKTLMAEKRIGVRRIEAAAGVSKTSVNNFVRGHDVTPDNLAALARFIEEHT